MILDILSRTTVYLIYSIDNNRCPDRPYCIPHLIALLFYPYCPLDTIVLSSHTLIVFPSYCSGSRLFLLFSLGHSHAIVLCRTIARSCISRVDCTLWSHSSFSLTVVPVCPLSFC